MNIIFHFEANREDHILFQITERSIFNILYLEHQQVKNDPTSTIVRALSKKATTTQISNNNNYNINKPDSIYTNNNNNNISTPIPKSNSKEENNLFGSTPKEIEKAIDIFTEEIIKTPVPTTSSNNNTAAKRYVFYRVITSLYSLSPI